MLRLDPRNDTLTFRQVKSLLEMLVLTKSLKTPCNHIKNASGGEAEVESLRKLLAELVKKHGFEEIVIGGSSKIEDIEVLAKVPRITVRNKRTLDISSLEQFRNLET